MDRRHGHAGICWRRLASTALFCGLFGALLWVLPATRLQVAPAGAASTGTAVTTTQPQNLAPPAPPAAAVGASAAPRQDSFPAAAPQHDRAPIDIPETVGLAEAEQSRAAALSPPVWLTNLTGPMPDEAPEWMRPLLAVWPAPARSDAFAIAVCESGLKPLKINYEDPEGGSVGLWQVNVGWLYGSNGLPGWELTWSFDDARSRLKDPMTNARAAYDVWALNGHRFGGAGGWKNCSDKHGIT